MAHEIRPKNQGGDLYCALCGEHINFLQPCAFSVEQSKILIEQSKVAVEQNKVAVEQSKVVVERNRVIYGAKGKYFSKSVVPQFYDIR